MKKTVNGAESASARDVSTVAVGEELPEFELPLTLQRLVMEAGVNRDFTPLHYDLEDTRQTGAPGAYANTMLIEAMMEAMLRNWMGNVGELRELNLKMISFNLAGTVIRTGGRVVDVTRDEDRGLVEAELWMRSGEIPTVEGTAVLALPWGEGGSEKP